MQDQILLLNILRRRDRQPLRFTTLTIIRGRSRVSGGIGLRLPFGSDAPSRFRFDSSVSTESGPAFEMSPQNNQEFFRGLTSSVDTTVLAINLRRQRRAALVLAVIVAEIRLGTPGGETVYVNDPEDVDAFVRFGQMLAQLLQQGLTTEEADFVRDVGSPMLRPEPLAPADLLDAQKQGLVLEAEPPSNGRRRRVWLRQIMPASRFCFRRPATPLAQAARCGILAGDGGVRRFSLRDRQAFGGPGSSTAVFDAGEAGRISILLRSPAAIIDYLGGLLRAQDALGQPLPAPKLPGAEEEPLFVVRPLAAGTSALAAVDTAEGLRVGIPAGRAGGHTGEVFSMLSQLIAEAQSVRNLPAPNAVTIVGD